jgi:TonB family protein
MASVFDCASSVPPSTERYSQEPPPLVAPAVASPRKVSGADPSYTRAAKMARASGELLLAVCLDADGVPRALSLLLDTLGHGMADAALQLVSTWRYEPVRLRGVPVPCCFPLRLVFRLN